MASVSSGPCFRCSKCKRIPCKYHRVPRRGHSRAHYHDKPLWHVTPREMMMSDLFHEDSMDKFRGIEPLIAL